MKMDLFDSPHRQEPKSTAPGESRSLPFSEDGEKGVLCALLLSARDVLDLCQIKLRPEAFYAPAHQILYNLVAELVDGNKPIDFITLKQSLRGCLKSPDSRQILSSMCSLQLPDSWMKPIPTFCELGIGRTFQTSS